MNPYFREDKVILREKQPFSLKIALPTKTHTRKRCTFQ